jgi:hypothetical protein
MQSLTNSMTLGAAIGEAMTAVGTTKQRWCEAEVYRTAGEIALLPPEPDAAKAEAYFERALAIARVPISIFCALLTTAAALRDPVL